MIKESVTIQEVVGFLNELLDIDQCTISSMMSTRFSCRRHLADHATVQVGSLGAEHCVVGFIGLLNGLFGIDKYGWGHISAEYEENMIKKFRLLTDQEVSEML